MDIRLTELSPYNTVLLHADGTALYVVKTERKWFSKVPTIIHKFVGGSPKEMGRLEIHYGLSFSDDYATVWGKRVTPHRTGTFSVSRTFTASDGKSYKWKNTPLHLVKCDGSKKCIASFDKGSLGFFGKARSPTLTVSPEGLGMHIGDDIIATFIFMYQYERERRRRSNGVGTVGVGGGGGGGGGGC